MATIALTIEQYNSPVYVDDLDMLTYLREQLEADRQALHQKMRAFQTRHGAVPQEFCDDVGQIGEDLLDDLRDVDPAYQSQLPAYEALLARHERDDAWTLRQYAAAHIAAGHEEG